MSLEQRAWASRLLWVPSTAQDPGSVALIYPNVVNVGYTHINLVTAEKKKNVLNVSVISLDKLLYEGKTSHKILLKKNCAWAAMIMVRDN